LRQVIEKTNFNTSWVRFLTAVKLVAGEFGLLEPVENFDIGYQEPFLPEKLRPLHILHWNIKQGRDVCQFNFLPLLCRNL